MMAPWHGAAPHASCRETALPELRMQSQLYVEFRGEIQHPYGQE